MAVETVPEIPRRSPLLPLDSVDRGDYLVAGVRAIVNLIACASDSEQEPHDDSIPMAGLIAYELLDELKAIVNMREG